MTREQSTARQQDVFSEAVSGLKSEQTLKYTSTLPIKKRSERRKHCALAVARRSQKFRPAADPLPGGAGRPKFNQLEMVTTFTYRPSLVMIDARNFELSW